MRYFITPALLIALKDLYSEWRTRQVVVTMLIFSALVIVTFSFAFDPTRQAVEALIPGMIWVITVFAGILGLNRSFLSEQKQDQLHGMIVAPADPASIYLGKVIANYVFVFVVQAISIPLLLILFDFQVPGDYGWFLLILFLGTFGFICVGTLLSAVSIQSKSSEMLLPVLLFPLVTPIVIAAVEATRIVLAQDASISEAFSWMQLIVVYDLVFFVAGFLLFEYVLEV
ncbi:heme exporter protein CcmB [Texcoconibacillus texcoconensis]|uniref:Heme exporter protein B n=1 Tax=Texcoconibacillus texcoconensis TaxID=1095777 RepID=A0A840QTV8_9BACI|nr:heme exporter protein CcmB [Texcoconibacillus texcoconensis]MBB5174804.1 heme exporter protein B [Texcoconibacillus texcoconensis]